MGSRSSIVLAVLVVATTVSCDRATGPRDDIDWDELPAFRTDSTRYTVNPFGDIVRATINVVFTNPASRTAYFVNCNGEASYFLQKRVGEEWKTIWAPVLFSCLSPPITVTTGATHQMQVWIGGGKPGGNIRPTFDATELAGTYRLAWNGLVHDYQPTLPWGEPLPVEARVSNTFELTPPP